MRKVISYPNVYIDTNSTTKAYYEIDENCNIYKNDENKKLAEPKIVIYETSSGAISNYAILTSSNLKSTVIIKLDVLMVCTFMPDTINEKSYMDYEMRKFFNVVHLDGNPLNNNLSNLKIKEFEIIWKPITYPGVIQNSYMISNTGEIFNLKTDRIIHPWNHLSYDNGKYYKIISLLFDDGSKKELRLHRLIAYEFIDKNFIYDKNMTINHINGNTCDNSLDNLEVCTQHKNTLHAWKMCLANYHGENHYNAKLKSADVARICELLLKHNGRVNDVMDDIKSEIPSITTKNINKIKHKITWKNVSDQYFTKNQFASQLNGENHYNAKYTEDTISLICKLLLEHNGSIKDTRNDLLKNYGIDINPDRICDIKLKHSWRKVSDKYFIYVNRNIFPIE